MLLILMFLVAFMGITLAVATDLWQIAAVREKEAQLLFVGGEYQRALARYKAATPPGMPTSPERLEQLLLDERRQVTVRHLRRLYRDPMTDSGEWGLIKQGGRIVAVYSLGAGKPLKQANFPAWVDGFGGAKTYAAWRFAVESGFPPSVASANNGMTSGTPPSATPPTGDAGNVAEAETSSTGAGLGMNPSDSDFDATVAACERARSLANQQCVAVTSLPERTRCYRTAASAWRSCLGV